MRDSFTPEEVARIENKAYEVGIGIGVRQERERIIALLEGMVGNMDGNYSSPKEVYGAVLDAIALIKGENK